MKTLKILLPLLLCAIASIIFSKCVVAQKNSGKADAKKMATQNMIDSQRFIFEAQNVLSFRGRYRNLTSPYNVSVKKDSMVSYLPYFGRAYVAPVDPTDLALDFTSTNFSYSATPQKKGGWDVIIKPKDKTDIQQFRFTIFDNGKASLQVTSTSRDPISFNGVIKDKS